MGGDRRGTDFGWGGTRPTWPKNRMGGDRGGTDFGWGGTVPPHQGDGDTPDNRDRNGPAKQPTIFM